jgi:hypothetical protein
VTGPVRLEARSLRALRWRARLPRLLALGCVALLALAGLRAALAPTAAPPTAQGPTAGADQAVQSFAEGFARAYLSWDPDDPELREQRLSAFLSQALDSDGGFSPSGLAREVNWTAVVAERRAVRATTVVVVAEVDRELVYLAVPVDRDERGFMSVAAYPALVGAPASNADIEPPAEEELEDSELRAVCERAVRNYLAGERRNLAADLADGAVVSLPARSLRVDSVESVTWVAPGRRVAVQLQAEQTGGTQWTLRYELDVMRRERWYVRQLHVDPRSNGATS